MMNVSSSRVDEHPGQFSILDLQTLMLHFPHNTSLNERY